MSKIVAETASIVNNLMEGPHFRGVGGKGVLTRQVALYVARRTI